MIFQLASRQKFRFQSVKGELTAEQLWDLPLQSKNGFDLDSVARAVNAELKQVTEDSFVSIRPNPQKNTLEQKLELVKVVIAQRLADNEAANQASARKAERDKLLEIRARKQDENLGSLSLEEIDAKIAALG